MTNNAKPFICSYRFQDKLWGFEIKARSHQDALERLKAIQRNAIVDGEVIASGALFPAFSKRFVEWLRGVWT